MLFTYFRQTSRHSQHSRSSCRIPGIRHDDFEHADSYSRDYLQKKKWEKGDH